MEGDEAPSAVARIVITEDALGNDATWEPTSVDRVWKNSVTGELLVTSDKVNSIAAIVN